MRINEEWTEILENKKYTDLEEVVETPGDDGVVVESDVERDDGGCDADAAQVRRNLRPDANRSLAEPLADGQLQEHDGQPLDGQHNRVRDQKRTCQLNQIYWRSQSAFNSDITSAIFLRAPVWNVTINAPFSYASETRKRKSIENVTCAR